mgnify:CR=1 FL=1
MTKIESGIKFVRSNIDQQVMEIERTQKKIQGLLDQLNDDFSLDIAERISKESNRLPRLFAELEGLNNQLNMLLILNKEAEQND